MAIEAFATIQDYTDRYGAVDDADMLAAKLDDSSIYMMQLMNKHGISYDDPDELFEAALVSVCCSVTNRIMPSAAPMAVDGLTSYSQTSAAGYSESFGFSTTYSTPKLNDMELELLGIATQRIGYLQPSLDKAGTYD